MPSTVKSERSVAAGIPSGVYAASRPRTNIRAWSISSMISGAGNASDWVPQALADIDRSQVIDLGLRVGRDPAATRREKDLGNRSDPVKLLCRGRNYHSGSRRRTSWSRTRRPPDGVPRCSWPSVGLKIDPVGAPPRHEGWLSVDERNNSCLLPPWCSSGTGGARRRPSLGMWRSHSSYSLAACNTICPRPDFGIVDVRKLSNHDLEQKPCVASGCALVALMYRDVSSLRGRGECVRPALMEVQGF